MSIALQNIYEEVEKRTKGYHFVSQIDESDPLVVAKLFDIAGSATWYITEYSADEKTFFGYVEGLVSDPWCDEWGYTSLDEIASMKYLGIPRIECDIHFEPKKFSKIKVRE